MFKEERNLVYVEIIDKIREDIIFGKYESGMKLPSVRAYASEYGMNPNTVQKAYTLLEEEGLIFTMKTAGRFVTNNSTLLEKYKEMKANDIIESIVSLKYLDYTNEDILSIVRKKLLSTDESRFS